MCIRDRSKYSAQKGKCAITGKLLEYEEIHCHHIVPFKQQGTDKYSNLIIIHKDIHTLIHAVEEQVICKYLNVHNLTNEQLKKVNELRVKDVYKRQLLYR